MLLSPRLGLRPPRLPALRRLQFRRCRCLLTVLRARVRLRRRRRLHLPQSRLACGALHLLGLAALLYLTPRAPGALERLARVSAQVDRLLQHHCRRHLGRRRAELPLHPLRHGLHPRALPLPLGRLHGAVARDAPADVRARERRDGGALAQLDELALRLGRRVVEIDENAQAQQPAARAFLFDELHAQPVVHPRHVNGEQHERRPKLCAHVAQLRGRAREVGQHVRAAPPAQRVQQLLELLLRACRAVLARLGRSCADHLSAEPLREPHAELVLLPHARAQHRHPRLAAQPAPVARRVIRWAWIPVDLCRSRRARLRRLTGWTVSQLLGRLAGGRRRGRGGSEAL